MSMLVLWQFRTIKLTPTISATQYSAGDVVGGLMTLPVKNEESGRTSGYISRVQVVDKDGVGAAGKLYVFSEKPAEIADHAAFALEIADWHKLIGDPIAISTYDTIGNFKREQVKLDAELEYNAADGNLYAYFVADATPDFTNTDALTFLVHIGVM